MELPEFYKLPVAERLRVLKERCGLSDDDMRALESGVSTDTADRMVENVIGIAPLPLGIATYFRINGRDVLIPMAIEESSVIAAASHAAKLCRPAGFTAEAGEPIMIGLVQLAGVSDIESARRAILSSEESLKEMCNKRDSTLVRLGGGLKSVDVDVVDTERGRMLVAKLYVDVRDAMGANAVNTMCEAAAPFLEEITGGRSVMKIVSNLAVKRMVRAKATWKRGALGDDVIEGMLDAYALARSYPYRAATNNKGIMNGVDAVLIAAGNDWRAAEAGCHSYAAMNGYAPLARYEKDGEGNLVGSIEMPMPVGTVGGATKINPVARLCLKIMGAKGAADLAMAAACAGLANNFAAVRAIVKEGIQRGHMKLHAKNIAAAAGAAGDEIDAVAERLVEERCISMSRAAEILKTMRGSV